MKNIFKHGLVQTGENNSSNNRGERLPMSGFDTVSLWQRSRTGGAGFVPLEFEENNYGESTI